MNELNFKTAQQAWSELLNYRYNVYDNYSAMYSGDHGKLKYTGEAGTFWKRSGAKAKIHVPIAADIAATSANLLFSAEPKFTVFHQDTEENESEQQKRLEYILRANNFFNTIVEAAETCAALGDIYFVLRWNVRDMQHPVIDIVQPDNAWAEYFMGEMRCLHAFSEAQVDIDHDIYIRVYERYSKGLIHMEMYKGNSTTLGEKLPDDILIDMGYAPEIDTPIDELLAVHVANVRPNRTYRWSMLGRSDLAGLRDLTDALDETYSSWIRDVRLAKAKLIVPVDYLRRKPQEMLDGVAQSGSWEFDPDIETYVAMDIQTSDMGGTNMITPSQFAIRSTEHAATCSNLIESILQMAGYSPQTFGMEINGSSSSGTALNIRERKSAATKNKKQQYWIAPLEFLITCMVRVDAALYPGNGSDGMDTVKMRFNDSMGEDANSTATTADMLFRAQSASLITRVRMQHPDWNEQEITDEVDRISREFSIQTEDLLEAFGSPVRNVEEPTE